MRPQQRQGVVEALCFVRRDRIQFVAQELDETEPCNTVAVGHQHSGDRFAGLSVRHDDLRPFIGCAHLKTCWYHLPAFAAREFFLNSALKSFALEPLAKRRKADRLRVVGDRRRGALSLLVMT